MEVDKIKFEEELKNNKIILVDFFATWCPPCKALAPIIEEVSKNHNDVKVLKVNVDDEQELAISYEIMNVPTLVFIRNGQVVDKSIGLISKRELEDFINKNK